MIWRVARWRNLIGTVVMALAVSCSPTFAGSTAGAPGPCVVHAYASADLPPEIAAFFADDKAKADQETKNWLHGAAVERCQFSKDAVEGSFAYTLLGVPKASGGVCYYTRYDITQMFSEDRKFLGSDKPERKGHRPIQNMVVSDPPCPRQDDNSYIYADMVSPGVFRSLMGFWKIAFTSDASMGAALSQLPPEQRTADDYKNFRAMARRASGKAPHPFSIQLTDYRRYFGQDPVSYEIDIDYWRVEVDLTDQGWRVVRLNRVVY